ncbi:IS66 family insertion sequence element accessory protein TnpA [Lewinella sp. IMCC34191]|uniref:IS66 family insertion sequence element accessory protein TnpA n=1 Tax=Lewinella sp. IMCC34191 TaxID=2259172 RepID=UPI000E247750
MYALVEHQASSGHSIKDFCAEAGISYATFHYWRSKFRLSGRRLRPMRASLV